MAEDTTNGFLDYKGEEQVNIPLKPIEDKQQPKPSTAPAGPEKPAPTKEEISAKLTSEALAAPKPLEKTKQEVGLVGGPLADPNVGVIESKKKAWSYDFGSERSGKNPFIIEQGQAYEFGGVAPSIKQKIDPNYKALDQESFNNVAEWIVKRQGDNFDKLYSNPSAFAKYIDESVRRVKNEDGYYLTDKHRSDLANRALTISSEYDYQRKHIKEAIDKSGVAEKMAARGYNPTINSDKEISSLLVERDKQLKSSIDYVGKQVASKNQKDIDQLKIDGDTAQKDAIAKQQELFNQMQKQLEDQEVAKVQADFQAGRISYEDAAAYVDGDGKQPSPMSQKISQTVLNSQEFKTASQKIKDDAFSPLKDRIYQLNQKMIKERNDMFAPYVSKINDEYDKKFKLIQSKTGMTQDEIQVVKDSIEGILKKKADDDYAKASYYRSMSMSGLLGNAFTGASLVQGVKDVASDMISSMFNNITGTYVNQTDVENSKAQFEGAGINTSALVEKEGILGAINPASIARYVGQQVPIMAVTSGVGLGAGAGAAVVSQTVGATVRGSRIIGATVGGLADWVASAQMNASDARDQAIKEGMSSDQADVAYKETYKNMSALMPLYMMQIGTLLSPSMKILQKTGVDMALETIQEHLENLSTNVALSKAKGEYGTIDPQSGDTMGLMYQAQKYLSSKEALETTVATVASAGILGGSLANLGTNVNDKLEKATLFKIFEGNGHTNAVAAVDAAYKLGKITDEQRSEGLQKIEALRQSIEKAHKMDLGDHNLTVAAVYKMYDVNGLEYLVGKEQDETVKQVLQDKLDKANKDLKDIVSGKAPVYVLYTQNSGPVTLSQEDVNSKVNDHDFVKALHDKTQSLEIVNDPNMQSKVEASVKSYSDTRAKNVQNMNTTAEENRMTTAEANELVDLQTKQEELAKTGKELSVEESSRMKELSSKGAINLAAIERRKEAVKPLATVSRAFISGVAKSLSKSFKNTKIVDAQNNQQEFTDAATVALKAKYNTDDVVFDSASNSFVVNGDTKNTIGLNQIRGWNDNGTVYYNPQAATKDTLIHEVAAHGWINEAINGTTIQGIEGKPTVDQIINADDSQLNDTGKLLKQGLMLMKDSDYHQELYGNSFYANDSLGSILEEALAQAIGEHGVKFKEDKIQQLKEWIRKFIPFLRGNKGKFIEGGAPSDLSIKDYLNGVMKDVFSDSPFGSAFSAIMDASSEINDRFENNETAFEDDGTPVKRNFSVSGSDIVEPKKSKYKEVKVDKLGHSLSFVKKSDIIDIVSLLKQIRSEKKKVWFWVADQLGRGYYYDEVIDGMHYLDAGPSYALDPVNREKGIIWASGLEEQLILSNIANSDYIFIISGSPERSKMFNQQVYDLFIKRAGDYTEFKKNILATSGISMLNKILSKYNSWEELRNDRIETKKNKKGKPVYEPVRKVFLSIINDQKSKQRTPLKKMLVEKNLFIDFDSLRDGFYRDNGFDINDIMLVLKPDSIAGKSNHSTYETDLSGSVVGVPDKIINAYDIISNEYKEKNKGILQRVNQSQVIAPFGSGIRSIGRKFQVYDKTGDAAKPVGKVFTTPHYNASVMVADYVRSKGLGPVKQTIVKALDINLSSAIADYYDGVVSEPTNPEIIAAYQQMADETRDQFDHMVSNGYSVEIYKGEGEPYKVAADMIKDLDENKHIYILSTKKEYGQGEYDQNDPLLKPSGRYDINGEELLNNDLFRAVHDFYGHAVMGNGFGPVGEENAWLIHSQMYSDKARGVMTTETRMQNSWVNFNESLRTVSITQEEAVKSATRRTTDFIKSLPNEIKDLLLYQWSAKQNPKWHPEGNTLKHAIIVLRRAHLMFPNDNNMILAALFHDLGKVDTYAISEKTGQPTAYGHEKRSVEYIDKFSEWVSSVPGVNIDEVKYLVQNHMKIKPAVWNQMGGAKKEIIEKHDAFKKLVKFTDKLDKGGIEISNIEQEILGFGRRPAKVGEEGYVPLKERKFAEQKKTIAPDWIVSTDAYVNQQPIIGDNHKSKFSVTDKDFPKDKNVNAIVNSKIYGQLTEDGKDFIFFHASENTKLDKIGVDPAKFGSNLRTSGEERRRSVPVSMYYTRADVSDVNYRSKYFVRIPKNKVYFFNEDALGLKEKAMAAFIKNNKTKGYDLAYDANEQIGYMMLEAKKIGYQMIIAKWGNGLLRAETVDKMFPKKLLNLDGNVIQPVTRINFISNAQKKKGQKIPKENRLASERDFKWYDSHVDDLYASDLTKDDLIEKMQTGKFVILTPENPNNQDYFEYENDMLVSDFEDEMRRLEIEYTPVIGKYGRYERSFIIFDASKAKAKSLCKQFKQESVAADFGIYYLDGDKFNPRVFDQDKFMDGQMSDTDDYMSTIMTTDGPVTFSLGYNFDKSKPFKSKFQIVGTEAARNVKSMQQSRINASRMEASGCGAKAIFLSTGWFRDFAGNWAYEIDNGEIKNLPTEDFMLLSELLDYDEIFKMYPDASNIQVKLADMPDKATASFDMTTGQILLNKELFSDGQNADLLKQSVMHELQHFIQYKEGFDTGSSLGSAIDTMRWVRDTITNFNDAIADGRVKLSEKNFERYMKLIDVDIKSLEAMGELMKSSGKDQPEIIPYWFDYGEMVARYSEESLMNKQVKETPLSNMLPVNYLFGLSIKRLENIHDAFLKNGGKIANGPGKKLNIPSSLRFQISSDDIEKAIRNERLARGTTMKAAANYFSGVKETEEEKQARLQLRDQIMLEIMAAQDAYQQAQVEAAIAREYEGKKRDIEEAVRAQELEQRITKRLNRKIRREQITGAFLLLGEREKFQEHIKTWEGTKSIILSIIADYKKQGAFNGKINARTLSTFTKMILNANTDKRLNNALAYLDKAMEDKRYDELVAAIRTRKDTIESMIKGDKNPFGNMYDSVVELISYDESKLFDSNAVNNFQGMETYLNMLDSIANKNMPDFKAYSAEYYVIKDMMEQAIDNDVTDKAFDDVKTEAQLNDALDGINSMEINSAEDFIVFRKLSYTLNKKAEDLLINGVVSQEKYDELVIAISRKSRSERIEQPEIRQKVQEFEAMEFEAAKKMINDVDIKTLSGFNLKYFNKLKLMVNKASGLSDFRKIGTDGIILLSKIAEQIGVGFVSPKMFKMINDVNVQVAADTMANDVANGVAESMKPGFIKRKISDDVLSIVSKLQGLPKQIIDQALSLGKSRTYYNHIVYELNKAFVNIRHKNKELNTMMNAKMRKYLVGPSFFSDMPEMERYRVGLLMKQLDYQSNIVDFENSKMPKDVTRHLLNDDFQKALLSDNNEYEAIKKAYESLPKRSNGDIDVEGAIRQLLPRERALFDSIRSLFDDHLHPMMQETNARRGELVESQNNYYRRYSQGVKQSSFDEDMTPTSVVANMETYKIRSGSTKSRVSDGLYWTVVDPEAVVFRAINEMTTDYYLSEAVPAAMATLKYANSRVDGKAKYILTALQQLTRTTLVTELTVNRDAMSFDIIAYANKRARNLLLSSPTRFFTEMIPSLTKGFISQADKENFGKALDKFGQQDHLYKKLYYDLSLPFKDNIGRFSLEGGESGRQGITSALSDAMSTMSDAMFSKFVFKTEFDTEFKRATGEEFDVQKYNEDPTYAQNLLDSGIMDQVAKVAMYNTERLTSSLGQFSMPTKMLWLDRTSKTAKILGFMQSYNAFEQKMFVNNLRDLLSGENEGRLKAARMSAGIITSGMMYTMITYFFTQLYKNIGGDDDETLNEELKKSMQASIDKQSANNMFIKSCINILSGGYGQVTSLAANLLYGYVETAHKKGHKLDEEDKKKFQQIKEAADDWMFFKPIDFSSYSNTSLKDGLSALTLFNLYVTPIWDMGIDIYTIRDKEAHGEFVEDKDKLGYQIAMGAHALVNFFGLEYPGMAMVHKSLKYQAQKEGEKIKKEKQAEKELKKLESRPRHGRSRMTKEMKEEVGIEPIEIEGSEKYND